MGKSKEEKEEKEFRIGQPSSIDLTNVDYNARVKFKALEGARYHKAGQIYEGSEVLVRKMEADGTAERVK